MSSELKPFNEITLSLNLNDLDLSEVEVEVLNNDDARALPEMGASYGTESIACCTICCCCCG